MLEQVGSSRFLKTYVSYQAGLVRGGEREEHHGDIDPQAADYRRLYALVISKDGLIERWID